MALLPKALQNLIDDLGRIPGVGPRTAERYAYYLIKSPPAVARELADNLAQLHEKVKYCPKTYALIDADDEVSHLYSDPRRDKQTVAVVADPFDIIALEKTGIYTGTYHVLGGLISPIDGIGPEQLKLNELIKRIDQDKVKEIILATNASVEGESTALLISQKLAGRPTKITRLARGLPTGVDLEYADQITLTRAIEGRQSI